MACELVADEYVNDLIEKVSTEVISPEPKEEPVV